MTFRMLKIILLKIINFEWIILDTERKFYKNFRYRILSIKFRDNFVERLGTKTRIQESRK